MNLLTEKYRPKSISTFVGNESAVASTKRFFMAWLNGKHKKEAILFHGGPGIGKTTLAHILAHDTGLILTHLNASDLSRKDDIEPLVHNFQLSFDTDKLRIILIDEADRIAKRTQGGLVKAIQESSHPIVVVVNDLTKVSPALKKVCIVVPFQEVPTYLIKKLILTISGKEKINLPKRVIIDAILRYGKTPRDAINLLEDYSISGIIPDRCPCKELTDNDRMTMILRGDEVEMNNVQDALVWFGDSKIENYKLLADTDMVNRMIPFYSRKMIKKHRGNLTQYPYSFRFKSITNKNKKEKPKNHKENKTKPIVNNVVERNEVDLLEWL